MKTAALLIAALVAARFCGAVQTPLLNKYGQPIAVVTNDAGAVVTNRLVLRPEGYAFDAPSLPRDPAYEPRLGVFRYKIFWGSAWVGDVMMEVSRDDGWYDVSVLATSRSVWKKLTRLRFNGASRMRADDFTPTAANLSDRSRERKKINTIHFTNGTASAVSQRLKDGKLRSVTRYEIRTNGWTLDPISVAMRVRGLAWKPDARVEAEVFDGRSLHRVTVICTGTATVGTAEGPRSAFVLVPSFERVRWKEKDGEDDDGDKDVEHSTRIYVAADATRDLLGGRAEAPIGTFELTWREYWPPEQTAVEEEDD